MISHEIQNHLCKVPAEINCMAQNYLIKELKLIEKKKKKGYLIYLKSNSKELSYLQVCHKISYMTFPLHPSFQTDLSLS